MKKAVITGPTGAIGIALINELIQNGTRVLAICHKGTKRIANIPKSDYVEIIEADLENLKECAEIVAHDYEVFFHFAWACTVGDSRNNIKAQIDNIQYTIDAVELASILGCKRFIGAGSQAEYGRCERDLDSNTPTFPENGYGIAKLCAGQLSRIRCNQLGIDHIWTRILSVYGPYDGEKTLISGLLKSFLNGQSPSCTKGEQIWDYIYSKDIAKALRLLAERGVSNKVYCLGSGEGHPLRDYIESIRNLINPNLRIGFGEVAYGEKQVMHLCADISELVRDTGFIPQYSFEEGMRETIEWVRGQKI